MSNLISLEDLKKHYTWLIKSPLLFESGLVANTSYQTFFYDLTLAQIDFEPIHNSLLNRAINNNKQRYHLPLGKYVETLFEQHFNKDSNIQLLQQNTQVQGNKETIGEIDYLLEIDQTVTHIELAIKFYLCYNNPQDPKHWIGPNAKDNLANKLTKNEHAFALTKRDQHKHLWKKTPTQWQWLIKGCWFFHPNQPKTLLKSANSNSEQGIWFYAKEATTYINDHQFYIPSKLEWITPSTVATNTLDKSSLLSLVNNHFALNNRAVMIWNLTTQQRICIVNNSWPVLQAH